MNAGASASASSHTLHGGKNAASAKNAAVTAAHLASNGGGAGNSSDDKDVSIILELPAGSHGPAAADQQQNDTMMDYDVADDNQWDIE